MKGIKAFDLPHKKEKIPQIDQLVAFFLLFPSLSPNQPFFLFETGSHSIAQVVLQLIM
jgi:hypothetical protein